MSAYQTISNRTLEKTFVTHQYVYFDDVFSKDELEKIIELNSKISLKDADNDIVDQAQDTMTILSTFIDAQSLNISDTNKLKTLMRELYVEALSTENIE